MHYIEARSANRKVADFEEQYNEDIIIKIHQ